MTALFKNKSRCRESARGRRPLAVWLLPVLLAATATLWAGQAANAPRVLILGFDGFDYGLTRDLMSRGRMPNFSKYAAGGSFGPLATSNPAQSPVAWSTFMTGLGPGQHGVFDFVERDPETLTPFMSTTRKAPQARNRLTLGGWQMPKWLSNLAEVRRGEPFWAALEDREIQTTIIRMPANFPPSGMATRELSGMGTPDMLDTYGRFSFFTSSPGAAALSVNGGMLYHVSVNGRLLQGSIEGPEQSQKVRGSEIRVPFKAVIDTQGQTASITIGNQERSLGVGEWSDWISTPLTTWRGDKIPATARFYLKQIRPTFELYVSPLNIDPMNPSQPISTPPTYATELAKATGRFYTQGMPEETNALTAGLISTDEFLRQARDAQAENRRQFHYVLQRFTQGVLFYYFGNVDQVSHILWGARDKRPGVDAKYVRTLEDLYVEFDGIVGEAAKALRPQDLLVVMSDHGFATWHRMFNLNTWLRNEGYLTLGDRSEKALLGQIDMLKSRAYGLGLTGVYVNLKGRESSGIVDSAQRAALLDEITKKLLAVVDPATGQPAVAKVFRREQVYPDNQHADLAPDLVIGYVKGTRVSGESALGGLSPAVFADNTSAWSGDHVMDPETVPGILLTNRRLKKPAASLQELASAILAELGVDFPES